MFNDVFADIAEDSLGLFTLCLGPFPAVVKFNLKIYSLRQEEIVKEVFDYNKWLDVMEDEDRIATSDWIPLGRMHYLMIKVNKRNMKVSGDFKFQFKSPSHSFYFWLSVPGIIWNQKLREMSL